MSSSIACLIWTIVFLMVTGHVSCKDASREKRDDAHKLIVTTIAEEPYVMMKTAHGKGNDNFEGLIPDMMEYISDKLQLHYEFREVGDKKYGSKDDNNHWNGMIGELLSGTADMAAAPMTISAERQEVVDFTESYEDFGTVLLMLDKTTGSIRNLDDLAKQSEVSYGIVRDGVTQTFFKQSNAETNKKIWENISNNPANMVNSVQQAVRKVRESDGKYVFIVESATAEYWVNKEPCDLKMVGEKINSNSFAFAMKQGSDYKEDIDEVIKDMKKNGKIQELRKKWKRGKCGQELFADETSTAPSNVPSVTRQVAIVGVMAAMLLLL